MTEMKDIPQDEEMKKDEMENVTGGPTAVEYAVMLNKDGLKKEDGFESGDTSALDGDQTKDGFRTLAP